MKKLNCWEFKKCGREPGGEKEKELGVCPVATEKHTDGINSGKNGGRVCWVVAGTFCGGKIQGHFVQKLGNCQECNFYDLVGQEEGANYKGARYILEKLK